MTSISKNVYINKLDDIVNKYNNTYRSTIKMTPADVKSAHILSLVKELIIRSLDLKLVILYQNIKKFLKKAMFQIVLKRFLWLKKIKTLCRGHMLVILKTNQKEFRIEKVIKRKGDKLHVKWKGYDNWFNNWIDKKDIV